MDACMSKTAVPYGSWPSEWSTERAASASRDFAELRASHGGLFWIEYDPADAHCTLWYWREGQVSCLTSAGFSVRSRVYEYGGGTFCLTAQGVAFVNEADQQIYIQDQPDCGREGARSAPYEMPLMLSERDECRYGDLQFDRRGNAIVALEERHGGPGVGHRLVSLGLDDGARQVLVEGLISIRRPRSTRKAGAWPGSNGVALSSLDRNPFVPGRALDRGALG